MQEFLVAVQLFLKVVVSAKMELELLLYLFRLAFVEAGREFQILIKVVGGDFIHLKLSWGVEADDLMMLGLVNAWEHCWRCILKMSAYVIKHVVPVENQSVVVEIPLDDVVKS